MVHSVDALLQRLEEAEIDVPRAPADAAVRNRISSAHSDPEEFLIRRLAADHLRELRDDGVTLDYISRMYGVSADRIELLVGRLIPSRRR